MKYASRLIYILCLGIVSLGISGCYRTSKPKPLPHIVNAQAAVREDVPIYFDAIGQAISPVTVNIRPQVSGKLIATYIQQGSIVKYGDIIYTIDPRPYQAILDEAQAQLVHDQALLEYANITVERYRPVVEDDFIAKWTFDQYLSNAAAAKAQVELDEAAVIAAQINVDFCNIVAPVSGKISYFAVDVGNILIIDDPNAITVIRPFSPVDIQFSIPQQQLELVREVQGNSGQWKFAAVLPEHPKHSFEGTTYFIDNQVNQDTGTILLKGRLPNLEREFWPGEYVKVKVLHKVAKNALVVPPGAILMGQAGPYLYTVNKEGKAEAHNVTVLTRTDKYIAAESTEVHAGDIIVTDGQVNIAPGLPVQVNMQTSTAKQIQ